MKKRQIVITDQDSVFGRYNDGCVTCPSSKTLQRKLTGKSYHITMALMRGWGNPRMGALCDDCVVAVKKDDSVLVSESDYEQASQWLKEEYAARAAALEAKAQEGEVQAE